MSEKKETPALGKILQKLAPQIGAEVLLEPGWGMVGQITFESGKRSYFYYNTLDINPVGAAKVAKDKDFSSYFLKDLGYPVVLESRTFFSERWGRTIGVHDQGVREACRYADAIGFPVVSKPNSGSQGANMTVAHNEEGLKRALGRIFKKDDIALVQEFVSGRDYRFVIFSDEVIAVYERIPLHVVGDDKNTIKELLEEKSSVFQASSSNSRIDTSDPRMEEKLMRSGGAFESIPEKDEIVFLLDNANLSCGGSLRDVTESVHSEFASLAINIARDMNLPLCGVDLIVRGNITKPPNGPENYTLLEVNGSPGLDHYGRAGKVQQEKVEALYLKILKQMDDEHHE